MANYNVVIPVQPLKIVIPPVRNAGVTQLVDSDGNIIGSGTTGVQVGVSQGASLTGVVGPLMQGAVASTSPSYAPSTIQPLSLTTLGALRAALQDTVGQPLDYSAVVPVQDVLLNTSDLTQVPFSQSTAASFTVAAGVTTQTIKVYRMRIFASAAQTATIRSNTTLAEGPIPLAANGQLILNLSSRPYYKTAQGEGLVVQLGTTGLTTGMIEYTQG